MDVLIFIAFGVVVVLTLLIGGGAERFNLRQFRSSLAAEVPRAENNPAVSV